MIMATITVLLVAAFLLTIYTAPRSIPILPEKIEETLNKLNPKYKVRIGETIMGYNGTEGGLGIQIKDTTIFTKDGVKVTSLPDVKAHMDLSGLLIGTFRIENLIIESPELHITTKGWFRRRTTNPEEEDMMLSDIGPHPLTPYQNAIADILRRIAENNQKIPLRRISMNNTRIILHNGKEDILWTVPGFSTEFLNDDGVITFVTRMNGDFLGKDGWLRSEGFITHENKLHVENRFSNIFPGVVSDIFPQFYWLDGTNMLMSGDIKVLLREDGKAEYVGFRMVSRQGIMPYVKTVGKVSFIPQEVAEGKPEKRLPDLKMKTDMVGMKMSELQKYWPEKYVPRSRKWVLSNITGGMYNRASITLRITPKNIINRRLSDSSVDAMVEFVNSDVNYYPELPPIKRTEGVAKFTGDTIEIAMKEGKVGNSELVTGLVKISGMIERKSVIEIKGHTKGSAEDLTEFIALSKNRISNEQLEQLRRIKGKAETRFKLGFPLRKKKDTEQEADKIKKVNFTAICELSDIDAPDIYENVSISGGNFTVTYGSSGLDVDGSAYVNSIFADLSYKKEFDSNQYDERYTVKTVVTPQELESFGFNIPDFIKGSIGVKADISRKDNTRNVIGMLDLKEAYVDAPVIDWHKPMGIPLDFSFAASDSLRGETIKLGAFKLEAENGLSAQGKAEFSRNGEQVDINVEKFYLGESDVSLDIRKSVPDSGLSDYFVRVDGNLLDARPLLDKHFGNGNGDIDAEQAEYGSESGQYEEYQEQYSLNGEIAVDKLLLKNDVVMKNVSGSLKCVTDYCTDAALDGVFEKAESKDGAALHIAYGEKDIPEGDTGEVVEVVADNNIRHIHITSKNAGAFLGGFGITPHIKDGIFEADGRLALDTLSAEGRILMNDYKVQQAPVLAKILSLGSFGGIVDLLQGEGISFDELKTDYIYADDTFTLHLLKTAGSSIGITAGGDINFKTSEVEMDGAVIPAYALNSLLGGVPLVGKIFIGEEGEGLIATRYSVKGKYPDPEVTVNPLSMLTPGFLRKVWGGKDVDQANEDFENSKN